MGEHNQQDQTTVDFDILNVVGVRLENATAKQIAVISRQLGPPADAGRADPDILIRMVDKHAAFREMRLIGIQDSGFNDEGFFIVRDEKKDLQWARIDFQRISEPLTIHCTGGGLASVSSLLTPILNFMMLAKDYIPLHAAAFEYLGKGVLLTGWSKSGKTETLLAFMEAGAKYIGDEYIYIDLNGDRMYGIKKPVTLWEWHLAELKRYWPAIDGKERHRIRILSNTLNFLDWTVRKRIIPAGFLRNVADQFTAEIRRRRATKIYPQKLFGQEVIKNDSGIDKIIFTVTHRSQEVRVDRMDPVEVAKRMVHSHQHQRLFFQSFYYKYRFSFPERINPLVENAGRMEESALIRVFSGKDAFGFYHPCPVSFKAVFEALDPLLRS